MKLAIKAFAIPMFMLCFTGFCVAQEGIITISQDNKIDELLDIYKLTSENADFYRIQVGFGSFQQAQNIKQQVDTDFPEWFSKIDFESPSYRVRVGKFKTKLEAERGLIEVRKKYPEAMLLKPEKTTS